MRSFSRFLAAAAGIACAASLAFAVDQTILGKSLTVKGGSAAKRKVTAVASEKNSPNTLVGDPTSRAGSVTGALLGQAGSAGGALLEIVVSGPSASSSDSFQLSQGTSSIGKPFWSGDATKGFRYKDPKGDQGAVKSVSIKRSAGGKFSIKAKLSGKNGTINVVPPNPGDFGRLVLTLAQGDRYSVQFGPESDFKNSATLFKARRR